MSGYDEWPSYESRIFENLLGGYEEDSDPYLEQLFDRAMFEPWQGGVDPAVREFDYQMLVTYLADSYGIDFEDVFDWEEYRSAYG